MKVITVCGSGKFKSLVHEVCDELSRSGFIVLAPPLHDIEGLTKGADYEGKFLAWKGATFAHLHRIATADVCLMVNPNGYLGTSSTLELGYAVALGKLVVAMVHDEKELAREAMFNCVLNVQEAKAAAKALRAMLIDSQQSKTARPRGSNG